MEGFTMAMSRLRRSGRCNISAEERPVAELAPLLALAGDGMGRQPCSPARPARPRRQNWPTKPIKFVVAYPAAVAPISSPGCSASACPKLLEAACRGRRTVPGAGGTLGALSVVRADPDGYTLLIAAISEISIAPATYKALPYDPGEGPRAGGSSWRGGRRSWSRRRISHRTHYPSSSPM